MTFRPSKRVIAVIAAALLLGVAGVALAQTQLDDRAAERQAFLDDIAKRLGVESADLEQALRDAQVAQIDRALAEGKITEEQAERLKEHVESGKGFGFGLPLERGFGGPHHRSFGPGGKFHHGPPAFLEAAATYLGLSTDELREALDEDTSLADVAKAEGKSVDGLEQAIVAAVEKQLDEAVKAGRITEERKTEFLDRFRDHVDELVQGTGHGPHGFKRHGDGGTPGSEAPGDETSSGVGV